MVEEIKGIRDLLIVLLAGDLRIAVRDLATAQGVFLNPAVEDMQLIAGLMIDSITPRSLELLAELHAKQQVAGKKKHH